MYLRWEFLRHVLLQWSLVIVLFNVGTAEAAINCVAPPVLSAPLTYDGKCPGELGFPKEVKAAGKDVYIKLPKNRICTMGLTVSNGRNIRITGGQFSYNDTWSAVITVRYSSGTTFIDGLNIDVKGKYADAIRTYNHTGKLIVQNTYMKGISGTLNGTHGDLVHPQGNGPLSELTLQNVTGLTGYQGLFTPYRVSDRHGTRKLKLDRVNVAYDPAYSKRTLKLLYIGGADSRDLAPPDGSTFANVYSDGSFWKLAYYKTVLVEPTPGSNGCATFAANKISGQVCGGNPPGGDFAPASQVGTTYNRAYFCK